MNRVKKLEAMLENNNNNTTSYNNKISELEAVIVKKDKLIKSINMVTHSLTYSLTHSLTHSGAYQANRPPCDAC